MYYATELVKLPRYKKVLEEIYRKPNISISKVKCEYPENPSLTGNAFEILFSICQLNKNKFERAFENDFVRAEMNLGRLNPNFEHQNFFKNGKLYCTLSGSQYDSILSIIRKFIGKKPNEFFEQKEPFRYFEISPATTHYPKLFTELIAKIGLNLFIPLANGVRIVGVNSNSYANYLKEFPNYFRNELSIYYKTGKCTRSFVQAILFFTRVSHQFALPLHFDSFFISKGYLNITLKRFQYFCKNHSRIKGKLSRTPDLDLLEITARPDFIISKKLYELKACKKFALSEYLQALTYLIFVQHPENRKLHGEIKSIILYYTLTNQKIEIKAKDLNLNKDSWIKIKKSIKAYKSKKKQKTAF